MIETWPDIAPRQMWSRWVPPIGELLLPWVVDHDGVELSLFSVMATLGSPVDLTLSELTVELFLPADDDTARHLRSRGSRRSPESAALGTPSVVP